VGRLLARVVLVSACLGLVAVLGPVIGSSQQVGRASQVSTVTGIDADPTGNGATSLGEIDLCVSVATGETFDVDIIVADVVDLLAWQATLTYDASVLNVVQTNLELFLASAEPGRLLNLSDLVPDQDGGYDFGVVDATPEGEGHSGSGVLARVTLQAVGTGASFLTLDGIILVDPQAIAIGDLTGDEIFDGAVGHAQVWVDEPCPSPLPTPSPTPSPTPTPTPRPSPTVGPVETPPSAASPTPPAATVEPGQTTPATPSEGDDSGGFPWAIVCGASAGAVVAALALAFVGARLLRRG
jgi:hypothetical protein